MFNENLNELVCLVVSKIFEKDPNYRKPISVDERLLKKGSAFSVTSLLEYSFKLQQ